MDAASQQPKVDNQPLAFSLKAVVYPWEYWNKVLVTGCSSWHQPAQIREETLESGNLFSSSWILPPYLKSDINLYTRLHCTEALKMCIFGNAPFENSLWPEVGMQINNLQIK